MCDPIQKAQAPGENLDIVRRREVSALMLAAVLVGMGILDLLWVDDWLVRGVRRPQPYSPSALWPQAHRMRGESVSSLRDWVRTKPVFAIRRHSNEDLNIWGPVADAVSSGRVSGGKDCGGKSKGSWLWTKAAASASYTEPTQSALFL